MRSSHSFGALAAFSLGYCETYPRALDKASRMNGIARIGRRVPIILPLSTALVVTLPLTPLGLAF